MISPETRCHDQDLVGLDPAAPIVRTAQDWAYDNLVPLNVSLEITLKCNIRCVHCYNFDRDEPRRAPTTATCATERPELSTDDILRLMGDLRQSGCLFLSLTGGEVLSHPDLFAFLDRASDLNLAVQLLTNGTLLRPGIAKRIAAYPNVLGASVSLYGATAEVHDGITQVVGSFARTWAGVERLRAAGVAVRLKFIVMRQNAHQAQAMMDSADARDFRYMLDMTVTARHDGTSGSLDSRVDAQQLEALCRGPLRKMLPVGPRPLPPAAQFNCNCARGNCAISARGDVYPCISVPWSAGNVRDQPFIDIWRHSPVFNRIRDLTLADFPKCAPCPHRAHCTHDRGAAFNATGDYTSADPFVCATAEIAHRLGDEGQGDAPDAPATLPAAPVPALNAG